MPTPKGCQTVAGAGVGDLMAASTIVKLYAALWSLLLSALWMATNSPTHPCSGWPVSLIVLDTLAWWTSRRIDERIAS